MKNYIFNKSRLIALIILSLWLFLSFGSTYAEGKPQYVPNEIIVKFKAEAANILEQQIVKEKRAPKDISLKASLNNLNKKHRVKKFDQIFKNFKKDKERLETLKYKETLKKKYNLKSITFTNKEERILRRLKRVPKDTKTPALDRFYKLELEEGQSVEAAVAEYKQDPNVEYAQPNYIMQLCSTPLPEEPYIPNDYYMEDNNNLGYWREGSWGQSYPDLYGLQKIQAIEAWNLFDINQTGYGTSAPGEGVVVAVIDSGIDYNHEDLQANIWSNAGETAGDGIDNDRNGYVDDIIGYDISDGDSDPNDYFGHGTHCAGTIAAKGNNTVGIAGIAYGAKIMPVKIFPNSTSENAAQGIRYAASNGADVLSNSWGPQRRNPSDSTIETAIDDAYAEGCVIVFAAGNANDDVAYYSPANSPKTIAVAAADYQDNKASSSNYGNLIDVAAPGVEVLSLRTAGTDMYLGSFGYTPGQRFVPAYDENARYYRANGTSMACPNVAGLAALILSRNPDLSNEDVRRIIRDSADDLGDTGFDIYYGYGRINVYKAILMTANSEGQILLDSSYYTVPANAVITVLDTDLNINPATNDTVTVKVYSTTETVPEDIILTEIAPDSGVFKGSIPLELGMIPVLSDGILKVQHNDIVTATYEEASPQGIKQVTAIVDTHSPIITLVRASTVDVLITGGGIANISWQTDEPSTSIVHYGKTSSLDTSVSRLAYVTEHVVTITGLDIDTPYNFAVESKDIVGNTAYTDNGGTFYQFIIVPPEIDVAPSSFTLEAPEQSEPFHETFSITARGDSVELLFEIPQPAYSWLSVSPSSGRISNGDSIDIQFTVDPLHLTAGTYETEIVIQNNTSTENPTVIPVTITTLPRAILRYEKYHIIDDWSGGSYTVNGDGRFNPGERIGLGVELRNEGGAQAQGVSATLSLPGGDPYVTILDDTVTFGDIPASMGGLSLDNFLVEAGDNTPYNHEIHFALDIADIEGEVVHEEFRVTVARPLGFYESARRLDTDPAGAATSSKPQIAADENGSVYVAWEDNRNGKYDIYFNYSRDYGATWQEEDIRLDTDTPGAADSINPKITCDNDGNVYVVWQDSRNGRYDIYVNCATTDEVAGVLLWKETDVRLDTDTPGNATSVNPQICYIGNGRVYVVWEDKRDFHGNGFYDRGIYGNYSSDYGVTWQTQDVFINEGESPYTYYGKNPIYPQICSDNQGNVYVVWFTSYGYGQYSRWNARFICSRDYGNTWQPIYFFDGNSTAYFPTVSCDDNGGVCIAFVYDGRNIVCYYSQTYGATWNSTMISNASFSGPIRKRLWNPKITYTNNGNVYATYENLYNRSATTIGFNYSHDFSASWQKTDFWLSVADAGAVGDESNLQNHCIGADNNGNVYAVWRDNRSSSYDMYFNRSKDYGVTWQTEKRLDADEPGTSNSETPCLASDENENVYIAWSDYRNGKSDIYFAYPMAESGVINLSPIEGQTTEENALLEFTVTATNSRGTPLELFFDTQGLPQDLQGNMTNATLSKPVFNEETCETSATFRWAPGRGTAGEYYPVVFVARDPASERCAYQAITITVINTPPYFVTPLQDITAYIGHEISFSIEANDPNGDQMYFGGSGIPEKTDYHDNGDGTATFTWKPKFRDRGEHIITFTVNDAYHDSTEASSETITITVNIFPPPVADFTASPTEGEMPLRVHFKNKCTPPTTSWLWQFGDGATSRLPNPIHTYNYVGTYTVCLTAKGPGGEDIEEKINYINVTFSGQILNAHADKDVVMPGMPLGLSAEITPDKFKTYGWLCDGEEFLSGSIEKGQSILHDIIDIGSYLCFTSGKHQIQLQATNAVAGQERLSGPFTITVAKDGKLIQDAIDAASPNSTVIVESGAYILSSRLNITKNITLKTADPNEVIIYLGSYCIYIKDPSLYSCNEYAFYLFRDLNDVTIEGITIRGYVGSSAEGAIQNYSGKLTLKNCKIIDNQGIRVSAIYSCWKSKLYLENTLVAKNKNLPATSVSPYTWRLGTKVWCGVIYLGGYAEINTLNSTIADNINSSQPFVIQGRLDYDGTDGPVTIQPQYGAIIRQYQNYLTLKNSIMWGNGPQGLNGPGRQDITTKDFRQQTFSITYCDIECKSVYVTSSNDGYYRPVYFDTTLPPNMSLNPQFVNPAAYDYNISATSPCKGKGESGSDMGARF